MILSGAVTDADLRACLRRMDEDPAPAIGFDQISDFASVREIHLSETMIAHIYGAVVKGASRCAIVTNDVVQQLINERNLSGVDCGHRIRVFQDIHQARHWLDSPEEYDPAPLVSQAN